MTTGTRSPSAVGPAAGDPRPPEPLAALSGLLAATVALGVGELLAGLVESAPSLVVAVGGRVVDLVPGAVERAAIAVLGTADKPALVVGICVLAGVFGAALGVAAGRRFAVGAAGFAAFGALGALAAFGDPRTAAGPVVLSAAGAVAAGVAALRLLLVAATPAVDAPERPRDPSAGGRGGAGVVDRRRFVTYAVAAAGASLTAVSLGRALADMAVSERVRRALGIPAAAAPLPPPPPDSSLRVPGLTPLVVPNSSFYRIDTALTVPRVDLASWRLRVTGMVDRPLDMGFDELVGRRLVEAYVTLACVSNEVGGGLVGNAKWRGVVLRELLEEAGVRPGATQVVGRSVDGFTAGFPVEAALDGRGALVAVTMNDEPLPTEHGFPARLVVPGLYGYVSATKWLTEIELTRFEDFEAYWVPRGWAQRAPVKTQSRIDVPRAGAAVAAGPRPVAGVAWAPGPGVAGVEVAVDDGPWQPARLSTALADSAWRQWRWAWDATPGPHELRVRATDGRGRTQTPLRVPPRPDGATGWHTVQVQVT